MSERSKVAALVGVYLAACAIPAWASGDLTVVFFLAGAVFLQGLFLGVGTMKARRGRRLLFASVYVVSALACWWITFAFPRMGDRGTAVVLALAPLVATSIVMLLVGKLVPSSQPQN